jgi:hypothetical protein
MRFLSRSLIVVVLAIGLSISLSTIALGARGWTGPTALTRDGLTGLSSLHSLASDGGRLHLFYPRADFTGGSHDTLLYRRSLDGGLTWEPERLLFATGGRFTEVFSNLSIAAHADLVVAVFRSHDAQNALLFARTSRDGGTTWGHRVRIDRVPTDLKMGISAVAISDAGIVVAWSMRSTGRIYTSISTDRGRTFGPPQRLATTAFSFICGNPDYRDGMVGLGADGNAIVLTWSAGPDGPCGPDKLYLRRSTDGGMTWKPRQLLPDMGSITLGWAEVAVQGKSVLLLLDSDDTGQLLLHSADGGMTFEPRLLDPGPTTFTGDVAFAPDGRAIVALPEVTLADDGATVTSSRLVTLSSSDGGSTWSSPRLAQAIPDGIGQPNVAFIGSTPAIAFYRFSSDFYRSDVYLTVSTGDRTQP